jgi:chromate transporter
MDPHGAASTPTSQTVPCTLRQLLLYFLRLGALGFGGPIALAGYMQRDLVEQRRWISRQDYVEGLALAQLAPGPLAAQLAIYLGWVRARVLGATLVSIAFIAPSLAMVLALSVLYVTYGGLPCMQGVFYGIGAAVIAVIARSAFKLVRMTLARDFLLWGTFLVSAVVTAWTEQEVLWIFLASGVVVMLVRTPFPRAGAAAILVPQPFLLAGLGAPATLPVLLKILWFFTIAGSVVFGSGLAIGVTAAATGAIAGAAFVQGKRAIFDVPTAAIAAVALLVLVKARKVPEPVLMLAAGAAGLILRGGSVR